MGVRFLLVITFASMLQSSLYSAQKKHFSQFSQMLKENKEHRKERDIKAELRLKWGEDWWYKSVNLPLDIKLEKKIAPIALDDLTTEKERHGAKSKIVNLKVGEVDHQSLKKEAPSSKAVTKKPLLQGVEVLSGPTAGRSRPKFVEKSNVDQRKLTKRLKKESFLSRMLKAPKLESGERRATRNFGMKGKTLREVFVFSRPESEKVVAVKTVQKKISKLHDASKNKVRRRGKLVSFVDRRKVFFSLRKSSRNSRKPSQRGNRRENRSFEANVWKKTPILYQVFE